MTPRRKTWLLVAVLGVAGVVLLSPYRSTIQRRALYVSEQHEFGIHLQLTGTEYQPFKMTLHRKRSPWLPGPDFIVVDQECPACSLNKHGSCFDQPLYTDGRVILAASVHGKLEPKGVSIILQPLLDGVRGLEHVAYALDSRGLKGQGEFEDFRCTCTDPSHQD